VGDIDFKVISAAENLNKISKNQVLEEKKWVEDMVTLGPIALATLYSTKLQICETLIKSPFFLFFLHYGGDLVLGMLVAMEILTNLILNIDN
jgi:hypothetical protein